MFLSVESEDNIILSVILKQTVELLEKANSCVTIWGF